MIKVTVDFETISDVNLKKTGAYEYSMGQKTFATCFGIKADNSPKLYFLDYYKMRTHFRDLPQSFQQLWIDFVLDKSFIFSAHNAFFEQCIYNNILVNRFGWPMIELEKWRCTAAKAAAVAIPRNLQDAGAVMNLSVQKDFEGHRVMMKLCKPTAAWVKWKKEVDKYAKRGQDDLVDQLHYEEPPQFYTPESAPEDYQKLYKYCKIDVLAEEKLDQSLPDLSPTEQKLWFLDQRINWRGVQVDMPVVRKISAIMEKESRIMGKELDVLTMGLVSSGNARNQILEFLRLEEIEMPDLKAKTVDEFLKNGKVTGDAKKLLEIRRALSKASTAKYQKFLLCAESDGRVRDLFLYHGASTGRWGGKNVQPQNFPRGVIKDIDEAISRIKTCSVEDLKLLYGENLMPLFSSVLRGMFIASPGHELFVEDLSTIELRVLWWLAGHTEGLKRIAQGVDPYKHRASAIFKKSVLEIDDGDERQTGKAAELGCGFQMGWKKFIKAAFDVYGVKVTEEIARLAVTSYREDNYPVVELWENYNNAAIMAAENPGKAYRVGRVRFYSKSGFLWIELPSGRKLAYASPSVTLDTTYVMTHPETEDVIYAPSLAAAQEAKALGYKKSNEFKSKRLKYWAVNHKAKKEDCVIPKWTREATYGGKITENVVQAVARDVLAEILVRAEEKGFLELMHSHDENVAEAPKGKFKTAIDSKGNIYCPEYREVMQTVPAWAKGLPLKSGGWVGERYKKG